MVANQFALRCCRNRGEREERRKEVHLRGRDGVCDEREKERIRQPARGETAPGE